MLEQELRTDIDERQKSLLQIKTLYLRYDFNEKDERLFLDYSIPTIYAIWEGFVTATFRVYIIELNNLDLTFNSVCKPILIHYLEKKFSQFKEYPKNNKSKIAFFEKLADFYNNPTINIISTINTESNVKFDVLNRILSEFNLSIINDQAIEYPEFQLKTSLKKELERLLENRNMLAHGQNSVMIGREDLDRAIKLIEILMELVFDKIIEGFKNKSYLIGS